MDYVSPGHQHDAHAGPGTLNDPASVTGGGRRKRVLFAVLLASAVLAFAALGVWQVERRSWKLDLIAAVDNRAKAAPVAAPGPGQPVGPADTYRHVRIEGVWLHDRETLVQALTELGAGSWVMTPLLTPAGWTVLVNRGFVPADHADPAERLEAQVSGPVTVTGLLRLTEPKGGFLRTNDPARGHWFSRDVAAIAVFRTLATPVPYFIDADATANPGGYPVGGLTVIAFSNNHLVYALTWFSLAGLSLAGLIRVLRTGTPDRAADPAPTSTPHA
jgi:surfeit locus 1 family protein